MLKINGDVKVNISETNLVVPKKSRNQFIHELRLIDKNKDRKILGQIIEFFGFLLFFSSKKLNPFPWFLPPQVALLVFSQNPGLCLKQIIPDLSFK